VEDLILQKLEEMDEKLDELLKDIDCEEASTSQNKEEK
jgi:hypothetical protein